MRGRGAESVEDTFLAEWGANALSPLFRLLQAKVIQQQENFPETITSIFAHLDYEGQYRHFRLRDADMFCSPLTHEEAIGCEQAFSQESGLEMRITLDLEHDHCLLEYNRNCPWYQSMDSLSIPISIGIENVRKLMAYADEKEIYDFNRLIAIYQQGTGIEALLEKSHGDMRLMEYLNSPQAQEDRERYRRLFDHQEAFDEEADEEMEER